MPSTMDQMVEAGARGLAQLSDGDQASWPDWKDWSEVALRAALPILGEELGSAVWLASKSGATHDQVAIRVRARLSEIMEGR